MIHSRIPARILSLVMILVLLAGCAASSGQQGSQPTGTQPQPGGAASPKQPVTIRWMDWSAESKDHMEKMIKKYQDSNPHVTVEYTSMQMDQYRQMILAAVKGGEAPDIFPVPVGIPPAQVVKEGWYQPLDPFVTPDLRNRLGEYLFEGGTIFDGKLYGLPNAIPGHTILLYYNKKLFRQAGLDPEKPPQTWSELRAMAKQITQAGKGEFYGIIEGGKQAQRWGVLAGGLAQVAGAPVYAPVAAGPYLISKEGLFAYDTKPFADAVTLLESMKNDGSYFPGFMSLTAPEARELFGQGRAAFMFQGDWCIQVWKKNNPDLDFGIANVPVPDSGRKGYVGIGGPMMWAGLNAKSKHAEEAAKFLMFRYSEEFLLSMAREGFTYAQSFVKDPSRVKDGNLAKELGQALTVQIADQRIGPVPALRSPATADALTELRPPQPGFWEVIQGVMSGSIKDPKAALQRLTVQSNDALAKAIKAAQDKGAKVSAQDFAFPNWDATRNYTSEFYKALGSTQ